MWANKSFGAGDIMRFVIQRVKQASVEIDGEVVGRIRKGFLVLIGISKEDDIATAGKMVRKLVGLRIFEDADGKTNLSLDQVGGELLLVSQFTLCADCSHGNRPSFTDAAKPDQAIPIYEYIVKECKRERIPVETGRFGADMKVSLINDGPFTIVLDSKDLA